MMDSDDFSSTSANHFVLVIWEKTDVIDRSIEEGLFSGVDNETLLVTNLVAVDDFIVAEPKEMC